MYLYFSGWCISQYIELHFLKPDWIEKKTHKSDNHDVVPSFAKLWTLQNR